MEKITFYSKDGLLITADHYKVAGHKGMILLCHRSHCNRIPRNRANTQKLPTGYLDAKPDIEAAIDFSQKTKW